MNPTDSVKNLSLLSLFVSTHVRNAMEAALVTTAADAFFHQHADRVHERFRTNPANTLPYRALDALEERSIVTVAEILNDEHKLYPVAATIRRKEDIFLHRHAISHPATVVWRKKEMTEFVKARRNAYDLRPALLWDLHRSINEELRANGEEARFEKLDVTREMAATLHSILDLSRGAALELWPVDTYAMYLTSEAPKYVAGLEKRPDGKIEEPTEVPFERFEIAKLYGECVCILEPEPSATLVLRASGEKRYVATFYLTALGARVANEQEAGELLRDADKVRALLGQEGTC